MTGSGVYFVGQRIISVYHGWKFDETVIRHTDNTVIDVNDELTHSYVTNCCLLTREKWYHWDAGSTVSIVEKPINSTLFVVLLITFLHILYMICVFKKLFIHYTVFYIISYISSCHFGVTLTIFLIIEIPPLSRLQFPLTSSQGLAFSSVTVFCFFFGEREQPFKSAAHKNVSGC